jgi:signal transduction histidine kinase
MIEENKNNKLLINNDKQKFKLVLLNLLDNAVKYTLKGKVEIGIFLIE